MRATDKTGAAGAPDGVMAESDSSQRRTMLQRRIEERMRALGMTSMRELSSRLGKNDAVVKQILNGTVENPRMDTLMALARELQCTTDYLSGAAEHNTFVKSLGPGPHSRVLVESRDGETPPGCIVVDELEVSAGAGGGAAVEIERVRARWVFPKDWLLTHLGVDHDEIGIITIRGDSMMPTLMPGDKVLVDRRSTAPSPPGIFAVWDGFGLVAKRLELLDGSRPARVLLTSDNERYKSYERTLDEVNIIGRIIGRWQRLGA